MGGRSGISWGEAMVRSLRMARTPVRYSLPSWTRRSFRRSSATCMASLPALADRLILKSQAMRLYLPSRPSTSELSSRIPFLDPTRFRYREMGVWVSACSHSPCWVRVMFMGAPGFRVWVEIFRDAYKKSAGSGRTWRLDRAFDVVTLEVLPGFRAHATTTWPFRSAGRGRRRRRCSGRSGSCVRIRRCRGWSRTGWRTGPHRG